MILTAGQQEALDLVLAARSAASPRILRIAGFAGTGKTAWLPTAVRAVGGSSDSLLLTPTGKVALRIRDLTGLPAKTIHRWLYTPMEDSRTGELHLSRRPVAEVEKPTSSFVFVDEASMVGERLWADLRAAVEALRLHVVLVGDGFQLPPVDPEADRRGAEPFSVFDERFRVDGQAVLTEVLRQEDGPLLRAATALTRRVGAGCTRH